jgi:integrase
MAAIIALAAAISASAASAQSTTGQITVLYDAMIEAAPAAQSEIAVRFHVRARRPIQHGRLRAHRRRPPPIGLAHPHMLRHACGFKLANDGHDTRALRAYLGHKNIQHTVR